jgi:hypothetical protein
MKNLEIKDWFENNAEYDFAGINQIKFHIKI